MSGNRIRDAPKEEKVMLKKVFVSVLTAVMLLGGIGAGAAFEPNIDYAQEANPAVFTSSLTREFYNSARNAYLHSAEMAAGYDHDTVTLDRSITIPLPAGMVVNEDMRGVCNRIGGVTYRFNITEINPFVYAYPRMDADLEKPHVRAIIEAAQSMKTDREKAEYLAKTICDRLEYAYDGKITEWSKAMENGGKAVCSGYATAFNRMGRAAGLLTFMVGNQAQNHAWNVVYCDGEWLTVDLTHYDTSGKEANWFQPNHPKFTPDCEDTLRFAQEVMIPSSTK